MNFAKTRPTPMSIGERRKPEPEARPGCDGVQGVYHINAVDEVTQTSSGAVSVSDSRLPFRQRKRVHKSVSPLYRGHGHTLAAMLNKLLIEQTKSRRAV
jgi:hypothetical protein